MQLHSNQMIFLILKFFRAWGMQILVPHFAAIFMQKQIKSPQGRSLVRFRYFRKERHSVLPKNFTPNDQMAVKQV